VRGVGETDLERCATGEIAAAPGVVELLTVLDLTVAENGSFGQPNSGGADVFVHISGGRTRRP
jgi:hypothetical protein